MSYREDCPAPCVPHTSFDGSALVFRSAPDVPVGPVPLPVPAVVFSEIMYHPVREDALVDRHEFLELYNRAAVAIDVSGWKLSGDVAFTFPAGTILPAGGYRVLA